MKLANSASPLIVSEGFDDNASIMGMSQEAALQMARHLRDTIYTDKILAVVREFSSNSTDEHSNHEIDKNVEIGVRDIDGHYEFFARDFAKGLSEEGIRTVFGVYGNSTKLNSNRTNGCYGVGSKCGFCYVDSYYVVSYFGGLKTIYTLALGGDENGSSNGFIYKTHAEPSNETGLEVIVPIKNCDLNRFSNEVKNFVSFSPHKIIAKILDQEYVPYSVVNQETHEGIDFSLFEGASGHKNNLAILQMGGVKYEYIELPEGFGVKADHTLVINVPIGSMTVALSRESFHNTPSNQNFKTKIVKFLEQMTERDFAHLKSKPLKDFIDENLGELHANKQVEGSIFKTRIANIYPETSKLIGNLAYVNYGKAVEKNGKPLLILIPNNSATDYWKSKLRDFARVNGESYYFACHAEFRGLNTEGFAEINKYFFPLGIKSLKFPKTKKVKTYAVYNKKYRSGSYNAVGFANCLRVNVFNLPEESDEILLKQWIESEKQKAIAAKNVESLNKLALTVSSPSRYTSWSCGSEELAQHVEDLGLFVTGRGEYSKLVTGWAKEQQEVQAKKDKVKKALKSWITFNPRTINLVTKERNAERLNKFWSAVMSEQTTRSKVFNHIKDSYENYYGNKNKLTRTEFRAIMRLERQ
jgi:hypothetical protein